MLFSMKNQKCDFASNQRFFNKPNWINLHLLWRFSL